MTRENQRRLDEIGSAVSAATVQDRNAERIVDVENYDWLDEIVGAR